MGGPALLGVAFLAGMLTVLAPCVLPVLPVILGGSLAAGGRWRPYIIVGSLAVSLVVFTLLLKVSTALLGVPAVVWSSISGGIIVILGIVTVWPNLYDWLSAKTGFLNGTMQAMSDSGQRRDWLGPVLIGAALGPVFASCSPTYALIIATILPASLAAGIIYLLVYVAGMAIFLLGIALAGRRLIVRLRWATNPHGWFKRGLGILFIVVGLAIITGVDKTIENYLIDHQLLNATLLEQNLIPARQGPSGGTTTDQSGDNPTSPEVLSNPQPAPELAGLSNWINANPQTIAGLKGKVVLIDFWTYSCINCIHTLPHVEGWYEKYQDAGLVVLGIHAPEFAFEHIPANVAQAVKDDHITYPVALDNNMATWSAYQNQYWPAEYFIDRQGNLRAYHFGEGEYDNTETYLRKLLAEDGTKVNGSVSTDTSSAPNPYQSPETYLGSERARNNQNDGGLRGGVVTNYELPTALSLNGWALGGKWTVGSQDTVAGAGATLRYKFTAKQVYLVMGAAQAAHVRVLVNGQPVSAANLAGADVNADSTATIGGSRLYRLVNSPNLLQGATLELQFDPGVTINAFTFDS